MKQNLTKILLRPNVKEELEEKVEEKSEVDEEYEAIFDSMPSVGGGKRKKLDSGRKKRKKISEDDL